MKKIFLAVALFFSVASFSQGVVVADHLNTIGTALYATHIDSLQKGGFRVVSTLVERNAITTLRRKIGMWVFVTDSVKTYRLNGGVTNSDWVEVTMGGSGGMINPMTTQGDIIAGGALGIPTRLGIGVAAQLLKVNAGATALEYFTPTFILPGDTANMLLNYRHWLEGYLKNITGKIIPGTNVTITGLGTTASPYVINSSGSGSDSIRNYFFGNAGLLGNGIAVSPNDSTLRFKRFDEGLWFDWVVQDSLMTGKVDSAGLSTYYQKIKDSATASFLNGYLTRTNMVPYARSSISLTTTGSSGPSTYDPVTGIVNVPQYSGSGGSTDSAYINAQTGTGGLQFTYATMITLGTHWVNDTNYYHCNYQGWVMMTNPNSLGYFWLDGSGGQHKVLLGGQSNATHWNVTGNTYDGSTVRTYTGSDLIPLNQWVHVQWIYDSTNMRVLINGIPTYSATYSGPRKTTAGGSDNSLLIGDNNHAFWPGRVKQVRSLEGGTGGVGYQDRDITKYLSAYFPDGTRATTNIDLSVKGTRLFQNAGTGHIGNAGHGTFTNAGESLSYGNPTWVSGDITQDTTNIADGAVPVGALVSDTYSRRNKLAMWGENGGLDSTEGGSLGKLQWKTGISPPVGGSSAAGILYGRAIIYSGQTNQAWVVTSSSDADIRVSRGTDWSTTGILARYDGDNGLRVRGANTLLEFEFREGGVTTFLPSLAVAGGWRILRVHVTGTTMNVYLDGVLTSTKTIALNALGVNHGITVNDALNWYDNFTIY